MNKNDVSHLLSRFLSARNEGKEIYFDADQIEDILDSFEESDDYTYYDEVLALGLKLHPGNNNLHIKQGRLLVYNEDYDAALALIETIAETENLDLDILRIECYCMQDRYDKVKEYTEMLVNNDCEYLEDIFEYIVPILSDIDMTEEAMDYIDRGLKMFPDNLILKDELCYNLEDAGQIGKAIEVCNELIDKNPYSYEYWFTLGRLYSMSAEYDKAIEAFDFALTCDDTDVELKILRAYCLYMNESYDKAIEVYIETQTENPEAINRIKPLLAECYMKLGRYDEAFILLKEYLYSDVVHEEPSAFINYLHCCGQHDDVAEYTKALNRAIDLFPNNIRILSLLAIAYMENKADDLADLTTEMLFRQVELEEEDLEEECSSLLQTGQYLFIKKDYKNSLKYYNKVLELYPEMPFIHIHLALAYLITGDPKAAEHLRKTNPKEIQDYMERIGFQMDIIKDIPLLGNPIAPEDLTREFLRNKDNSN